MGLVTERLHIVVEVLAGQQGPLSDKLLDHGGADASD